jgi:threonine dehydratase
VGGVLTPTLAAIEAARERIRDAAIRTPLVRLGVPDAPTRIHLKLENLQPIGSFKIRGAANAVAGLSLGVPCTVIAPETAPETKLAAIERMGGRVIEVSFERWWQTFESRAFPGVEGAFIHAFDDPDVMAGNGTIGLEIVEDLPDVDAIVIPWGGGGLACGIASAVRALRPGCRLFAAEVDTASPLAAALAAGAPRVVDYRPSFVDGIGSKTVLPQMLERARPLFDGSLVATLAEVAAAVRLLAERNRIIAEGAGACPVACALSGRAGVGNVVCVVSGGNIDLERFSAVIEGRM